MYARVWMYARVCVWMYARVCVCMYARVCARVCAFARNCPCSLGAIDFFRLGIADLTKDGPEVRCAACRFVCVKIKKNYSDKPKEPDEEATSKPLNLIMN